MAHTSRTRQCADLLSPLDGNLDVFTSLLRWLNEKWAAAQARSKWRHEQKTVTAALAADLHHSGGAEAGTRNAPKSLTTASVRRRASARGARQAELPELAFALAHGGGSRALRGPAGLPGSW